jgi:hypothetical protein
MTGWAFFDPLVLLCALLAGIGVELLRPYRPFAEPFQHEDTRQLEAEIAQRVASGTRWAYIEVQNPWWLTMLVLGLSLVEVIGGVFTWSSSPGVAMPMFFVAALIWLLYGGLRVIVNTEGISARIGVSGIRLAHISWERLSSAELREFSPLREYGGYGIRFNLQSTAFIFSGNRGVLMQLAKGRPLLLGSDTPERLLAVIQAAQRAVKR